MHATLKMKGETMVENISASAKVSRRGFVQGAGAAVAGAALACAPAAAVAQETSQKADSMAAEGAWDAEADIVICGLGCAGLAAAITACTEELGTTINLEAAPKELRGGDSCCTQGVLFGPNDKDAAITYQSVLNDPYEVPADVVDAWAEDIVQNVGWLEDVCGARYHEPDTGEPCFFSSIGEFPMMTGAEECPCYKPVTQAYGQGQTWGYMMSKFDSLNLPVYYEARAVELIQDETGKVVGVRCEDGRRFKANKGVLLATGGFEASKPMMEMYNATGHPNMIGKGSLYNRGDGIRMAQRLGADLWHMNNISGCMLGFQVVPGDEVDARASFSHKTCEYIYVDKNGERWINESVEGLKGLALHGKYYHSGTWMDMPHPDNCWCIMGQGCYDEGGYSYNYNNYWHRKAFPGVCWNMEDTVAAGITVKCDTIADIAKVTGLDEQKLADTIGFYNDNAANNEDPIFHRGVALTQMGDELIEYGHEDEEPKVEAFDLIPISAPYYVTQLKGCMYNTQGGPKRSANCEILDVDDNPIPGLYAAGEMGCEYAYIYNVGGNISEAVSSGRRAARVVLTGSPAPGAYNADAKAPNPLPKEEAEPNTAVYKDGTYTGAGVGINGPLQVSVAVEGGKVANVELVDPKETQGIGDAAATAIAAEIVEANGTEGVDVISGASTTSRGVLTAAADALSQAR